MQELTEVQPTDVNAAPIAVEMRHVQKSLAGRDCQR